MASIKFHFHPSVRKGRHEGKLFIRIIHHRKVKNITTDYTLFPEEWDSNRCEIIFSSENPDRIRYLLGIREKVQDDKEKLQIMVESLARKGVYTVDDIHRKWIVAPVIDSLHAYCRQIGIKLRESGQERTARAYLSAIRSLIKFNSGNDLSLADINSKLIRSYEKHLIDNNLHMNTISFYIRNIRAVYHRAVNDKIIFCQEENPFDRVFTGVHETRRRALSKDELRSLAKLETILSDKVQLQNLADDILSQADGDSLRHSLMYFLFCFHARGMSFIDMAFLRKNEIEAGVISYKRKKTKGRLAVKVTAPMRKIISHFTIETKNSPYVFPIIDPLKGNERRQYESGLWIQNKHLKILAGMAGIRKPLTTHLARHRKSFNYLYFSVLQS